MWAPIDINAIPTPDDVENATKAIEEVERQLEEALEALERARILVADLGRDLQQRRAWLSPVRRLNFDILCRVFQLAGKDNWKALIRLASVSQTWRSIALSTPRAWSFLDLYLERSGHRLLHIGLPRYGPYLNLISVGERLQCLSVFTFPTHLSGIVFPHVRRLYIRNTYTGVLPTSVTRKHFPALRHLHCHSIFTREHGHRLEDDDDWTYDLPPLKTVGLPVSSNTTWICFLRNCSETVTSLRLELREKGTRLQRRYSITMPLLKCLEISGRMVFVGTWPLNLKTPVLESYISHRRLSEIDIPVHSDLETVEQIRLSGVRPLNNCTNLRLLQILNGGAGLYPILTMLERDMTLCPALEVITVLVNALFPLDGPEFTRRVEEISKGRNGLKVLCHEVITEKFKGEMIWSVSRLDAYGVIVRLYSTVRMGYAL